MNWLVLFFPSWKFFGDLGVQLRIEVYAGQGWRPLLKQNQIFCFKNIFSNPQINLYHAINNNIIFLRQEIDSLGEEHLSLDELQTLKTYRSLKASIIYMARKQNLNLNSLKYRVISLDLSDQCKNVWFEDQL